MISFGGTTKYSNDRQINGAIVAFFEEYRISNTVSFLFEQDITLPDLNEKSWIHETVYTSERKFLDNSVQPNIILLFPDGIPARLINGYRKIWNNGEDDNILTGLTPNIDKMMTKSMVFDNYYNHTAATYPGLVGTLTSSFPFRGIDPKEIRKILNNERIFPQFSSIFGILEKNNYESHFIVSDTEYHLMHDILKIKHVYYAENFVQILPEYVNDNYLSEKEIFSSIQKILEKIPKPSQNSCYRSLFSGNTLKYQFCQSCWNWL